VPDTGNPTVVASFLAPANGAGSGVGLIEFSMAEDTMQAEIEAARITPVP
jgi:hypothetical protein